MQEQTKVTGVILAGGLARRMGGGDKGLILYKHRPMLAYAVDAMRPLVDCLLLNVNRNFEYYREFGLPLLTDGNSNFDGPLAGILAALRCAQGRGVLLVMPCDSPLVDTGHLQKLLQTLQTSNADCCTAFDGDRLHPVFLALQARLLDSLAAYLASGERKTERWLQLQRCVKADFSMSPEIFRNINTFEELAALEAYN